MKRSMKTIFKEAVGLFWEDIKNMRFAILALAVYFWINKTFFYSSCVWVIVTGFPCPGCGLTRAGFALLRGDFIRAYEIHPFIYGIVVLFFAFCFYRYILKRSQKVFVKWAIVLIIAMIAFYVYRMICEFPGEPPMAYYQYNLIHTFLK